MPDRPTAKTVDFSSADLSRRVWERLREVIATPELRRKVARLSGIPELTLKDYFTGRTSPSVERFLLIATAAGVPPARFFPALSDDAGRGVVQIPVLDVAAAAGPGRNADVVRAVDELVLPESFLEKVAPPDADLSCLRCAGDSMLPTIEDGALLIIDQHQCKPRPWRPLPRKSPRRPQPRDDIFVFNQSGDLRLKRLRDIGDDFVAIISDNHADNPVEIFKLGRDGGFAIIGKVIWWDNRL